MLHKLGPAEELLRDALEPPPTDRVADALDSLIRLGAIEGGGDGGVGGAVAGREGHVTPLGAFAARLPMLEIPRARLVLMACLAGSACEGVLVAAALSSEVFTTPSPAMCRGPGEFAAAVGDSLLWRRAWDAGSGGAG